MGLLYRLLEGWPLLAVGRWPPTGGNLPEGYRGPHKNEAHYVPAIIAYVDIAAALQRLPPHQRRLAHTWLKNAPGVPPHWLVEAVWREVN